MLKILRSIVSERKKKWGRHKEARYVVLLGAE